MAQPKRHFEDFSEGDVFELGSVRVTADDNLLGDFGQARPEPCAVEPSMPPNDVVIRPALPSDADALFPLVQQFATSYRPARAAFDRHFPRLLAAEHADLLVAEVAGRLVGYALAFHLLTLYANGIVAELQELMVEPEHRGRGIGRRLVEATLSRAQAAGAAEVTVPTRRARDYYLRLGFEDTATYLKRKLRG